jgi:hypothetical protein
MKNMWGVEIQIHVFLTTTHFMSEEYLQAPFG